MPDYGSMSDREVRMHFVETMWSVASSRIIPGIPHSSVFMNDVFRIANNISAESRRDKAILSEDMEDLWLISRGDAIDSENLKTWAENELNLGMGSGSGSGSGSGGGPGV